MWQNMVGHNGWPYELVPGIEHEVFTTMSSKKVITCETAPLSLLLNTTLGWSSQQSLVQLVAGSTPVSSQNALTMGETAISHTFPFGHCHHQPHMASPTLCKVWEYTSNHSALSTSPCTLSRIMNCPMFRMVGVGRQTSQPCTLRLHCQMVRRCLASKRAVPLAPDVNGVMHSYQGTSSSKIPWTTNCNQHVICQVGSTVSSISSSSLMSMQYTAHCPGLPPEHLGPPPADAPLPLSPHRLTWWTSSWSSRSGWTGNGGNIDHWGHFQCGGGIMGHGGAAVTPHGSTRE